MALPAGNVVIVGGGPAGTCTAIALARAAPELASRVVILEKERYPREKFCAGALGRRGWSLLERLDAVPQVPQVPIDGISMRVAAGEVMVRPGNLGSVIRRIELDHALVEIARRLGVRVVEGVRVTRVAAESGGARVSTDGGDMTAALVVGADGVGSVVRKVLQVGAEGHRAQVLEVDTPPVPADRDRGILHFDASDPTFTGYTWDFPTLVKGEPLYCRGIYALKTKRGADIQEKLRTRLASMGLDLAACRNKRFAERGLAPHGVYADGPIVLVGEAAGIDPLVGEGIPQAIEFASLAGPFIADVLQRGRQANEWSGVLAGSRLAFDLRIRNFLVGLAYGAARPDAERWVFDCPQVLAAGCDHFAANDVRWAPLAEALLHGGWKLLSGALQRTLAAARQPG